MRVGRCRCRGRLELQRRPSAYDTEMGYAGSRDFNELVVIECTECGLQQSLEVNEEIMEDTTCIGVTGKIYRA